jgi:8-oxo-dGTP diphosphatase
VSTDLPFLPLRTERLILRVQRLEDAERLSDLSNDLDVVRHLARVPYPNPPERVREYIASGLENLAAGCEVPFAITSAASGEVMGTLSLRIDGVRRQAEIGYWLGKSYWGQGFMSEAISAVVGFVFGPLQMKKVWASAQIENEASLHVLAKAGLVETHRGVIKMPARDYDEADAIFMERLAPRTPLLVAAVALIDRDDRVLLAQRPPGKSLAGLWEFPGGKVDPGETPEAALIRELKEELDVDTAESCLAPFTFASHSYDDFHLLMPLYVCRVWQGNPTPMEGQNLAWVRPLQMKDYPMPPADKPLVAMLRDLL